MILFVGTYPEPGKDKDGMVRRVAAIDSYFEGHDRVYLDVSLRKHLPAKKNRVSHKFWIYKLNLFIHWPLILYLGFRASLVYVHSVHYAALVIPLYFFKKVITDLHGVVPEELVYQGKKGQAVFCGLVEGLVVWLSHSLIAVSRAMAAHFKKKYNNPSLKIYVIPVLNELAPAPRGQASCTGNPTVIYAGGMQKWQNPELMVETIIKAGDLFEFILLTGDPCPLKEKLAQKSVRDVKVLTAPPEAVFSYYNMADFGFLLRENNIVNRVACPTKLAEYLAAGVVPVVLQPFIGDAAELGYAYLTLEDLIQGKVPAGPDLEAMRKQNYRVLKTLRGMACCGMKELLGRYNLRTGG